MVYPVLCAAVSRLPTSKTRLDLIEAHFLVPLIPMTQESVVKIEFAWCLDGES